MTRAERIPGEIVEAVAHALYACEKRRADHTDEVFSVAAGKLLKSSMEPWEECSEIFLGDARAAINAYFAAAFPTEVKEQPA